MSMPRSHSDQLLSSSSAATSASSWDCILPGPPSKNNGGAADLSSAGLFAYASGSSVTVIDTHSMQLVSTIAMPPPSPSAVSPFITAVRWSPIPLPHLLLENSSPHLLLAVGDRHGRISFLDFRSKSPTLLLDSNSPTSSKFGIQDRTDASELQRLERDSPSNVGAPASAAFPTYLVKFAFSPHWKHVILVGFSRELVVFDLQYESVLFSTGLPRGCGKVLDVLPDASMEIFYCAHMDGKFTTWRCKEGEQVHVMCSMEELIPLIGTSVPSPSLLAVTISQLDSTLQDIGRLCLDTTSHDIDFDNPFDFVDESSIISRTHLLSISDDGKLWKWCLTAEDSSVFQKDIEIASEIEKASNIPVREVESQLDFSADEHAVSSVNQQYDTYGRKNSQSRHIIATDEVLFKVGCLEYVNVNLVGQLHLLSSTVTMLAVPSPSLTATLARGGNTPAVAVPLVALGTQNGTVDVIDISANAVAASFSVHSSMVRGLRWLGNSRLVSFSYSQVDLSMEVRRLISYVSLSSKLEGFPLEDLVTTAPAITQSNSQQLQELLVPYNRKKLAICSGIQITALSCFSFCSSQLSVSDLQTKLNTTE
ncbi:WD repeat-containing protein 11-like [Dorcoceras hygrometricum]|uniref:WD repeat-containing protein 11-like n=1 Tax=Dorcoceras hygrometricum TaxID=472368 RepID=A0A2Z7AB19_9LAMI|nr:WD repeat-containing protein 11-like [Dorcoceras hygrometricum]